MLVFLVLSAHCGKKEEFVKIFGGVKARQGKLGAKGVQLLATDEELGQYCKEHEEDEECASLKQSCEAVETYDCDELGEYAAQCKEHQGRCAKVCKGAEWSCFNGGGGGGGGGGSGSGGSGSSDNSGGLAPWAIALIAVACVVVVGVAVALLALFLRRKKKGEMEADHQASA
jgi:hypothetical protein